MLAAQRSTGSATGIVINFAKRAQLCASMLHSAGAANFSDIARLT